METLYSPLCYCYKPYIFLHFTADIVFHDRKYSVLISSQDILKTISLAVNEETNGVSWERLGGAAKRRKCVTLMINALENAGKDC